MINKGLQLSTLNQNADLLTHKYDLLLIDLIIAELKQVTAMNKHTIVVIVFIIIMLRWAVRIIVIVNYVIVETA